MELLSENGTLHFFPTHFIVSHCRGCNFNSPVLDMPIKRNDEKQYDCDFVSSFSFRLYSITIDFRYIGG